LDCVDWRQNYDQQSKAKKLSDRFLDSLVNWFVDNNFCSQIKIKEGEIINSPKALKKDVFDKAKDIEMIKFDGYSCVTIFKLNIYGQEKTFVEINVPLAGLTIEQKIDWWQIKQSKLHDYKGELPIWYKKLPDWRQKLLRNLSDKVLEGYNTHPTQWKDISGSRNAFFYQVALAKEDDDHKLTGELTILGEQYHCGTLASLGKDKVENWQIAVQNAIQIQLIVTGAINRDIFLHSLNSPNNPLSNVDAKIFAQSLHITKFIARYYANTALNKLRRAPSNEASYYDQIGSLINDFASELRSAIGGSNSQLDAGYSSNLLTIINSIADQTSTSHNLETFLQEIDSYDQKNEQLNKIIKGLLKLKEIINYGIGWQEQKEDKKATVSVGKIKKILLREDPENTNLIITTELSILIMNMMAWRQNQNLTGKIIHVICCASGKDRTQLAMAMIKTTLLTNQYCKESDEAYEYIFGQILTRVLVAGHAQNQNGSVFAAGCNVATFGTKTENFYGLPQKYAGELEYFVNRLADLNKLSKSEKSLIAIPPVRTNYLLLEEFYQMVMQIYAKRTALRNPDSSTPLADLYKKIHYQIESIDQKPYITYDNGYPLFNNYYPNIAQLKEVRATREKDVEGEITVTYKYKIKGKEIREKREIKEYYVIELKSEKRIYLQANKEGYYDIHGINANDYEFLLIFRDFRRIRDVLLTREKRDDAKYIIARSKFDSNELQQIYKDSSHFKACQNEVSNLLQSLNSLISALDSQINITEFKPLYERLNKALQNIKTSIDQISAKLSKEPPEISISEIMEKSKEHIDIIASTVNYIMNPANSLLDLKQKRQLSNLQVTSPQLIENQRNLQTISNVSLFLEIARKLNNYSSLYREISEDLEKQLKHCIEEDKRTILENEIAFLKSEITQLKYYQEDVTGTADNSDIISQIADFIKMPDKTASSLGIRTKVQFALTNKKYLAAINKIIKDIVDLDLANNGNSIINNIACLKFLLDIKKDEKYTDLTKLRREEIERYIKKLYEKLNRFIVNEAKSSNYARLAIVLDYLCRSDIKGFFVNNRKAIAEERGGNMEEFMLDLAAELVVINANCKDILKFEFIKGIKYNRAESVAEKERLSKIKDQLTGGQNATNNIEKDIIKILVLIRMLDRNSKRNIGLYHRLSRAVVNTSYPELEDAAIRHIDNMANRISGAAISISGQSDVTKIIEQDSTSSLQTKPSQEQPKLDDKTIIATSIDHINRSKKAKSDAIGEIDRTLNYMDIIYGRGKKPFDSLALKLGEKRQSLKAEIEESKELAAQIASVSTSVASASAVPAVLQVASQK
jgi:hypothetical protein